MKKRLQACSHYCEAKKGSLYAPQVTDQDVSPAPTPTLRSSIKKVPLVFPVWKKIKNLMSYSMLFQKKYDANNNLGIFLTTVCNLSCNNCQTSARQAPANDIMTVAQVEKLVNEAIGLEYYWDTVYLTGGEVTTHPQLPEVFAALKRYKDFNPECRIVMETNGAGARVQSVLPSIPSWVVIDNSSKKEGPSTLLFYEYNVAPKDTLTSVIPDYSKGCSRLKYCFGLCASMYGFYACTPCLNVARVFGFDIGIKELSLVSEKALREQLKVLCQYCGWFREPSYATTQAQTMSKSWRKAFAEFRKRKPRMSAY